MRKNIASSLICLLFILMAIGSATKKTSTGHITSTPSGANIYAYDISDNEGQSVGQTPTNVNHSVYSWENWVLIAKKNGYYHSIWNPKDDIKSLDHDFRLKKKCHQKFGNRRSTSPEVNIPDASLQEVQGSILEAFTQSKANWQISNMRGSLIILERPTIGCENAKVEERPQYYYKFEHIIIRFLLNQNKGDVKVSTTLKAYGKPYIRPFVEETSQTNQSAVSLAAQMFSESTVGSQENPKEISQDYAIFEKTRWRIQNKLQSIKENL